MLGNLSLPLSQPWAMSESPAVSSGLVSIGNRSTGSRKECSSCAVSCAAAPVGPGKKDLPASQTSLADSVLP